MNWKGRHHPNAFYVTLASAYVHAAIRRGHIPCASKLRCVDCGRKAYCYDHRDYWEPMKIEPVCRQCNVLRGAGKNGIAKSAEHARHSLLGTMMLQVRESRLRANDRRRRVSA